MFQALVDQEIGAMLSVKDLISSRKYTNDLDSVTSKHCCNDLQYWTDQWQSDVEVFKQLINTLIDDSLGWLICTTSAS